MNAIFDAQVRANSKLRIENEKLEKQFKSFKALKKKTKLFRDKVRALEVVIQFAAHTPICDSRSFSSYFGTTIRRSCNCGFNEAYDAYEVIKVK